MNLARLKGPARIAAVIGVVALGSLSSGCMMAMHEHVQRRGSSEPVGTQARDSGAPREHAESESTSEANHENRAKEPAHERHGMVGDRTWHWVAGGAVMAAMMILLML
ncbi:MAG: hypothetical protein HY900_20145 [Deltaproteobacteria bacterium]|nr:hypothetical protein [Deltaproteobacteria bacterium]